MRSFRVELPDDDAGALDVEAELLGFESVDAYLRWLVDGRFSLERDGERGRTLAAYRERLDDRDAETPLAEAAAAAAREVEAVAERDVESRIVPREVRVEDGTLADDAAALTTVERDRVDALARRAVTETRRELGDVGTGIDYRSRTDLGDADRPGADVTDLAELDVPGWDEQLIERRRDAVGAALAFLRDAEAAKRSAFVDALFEAYPAGYESESAWWECIKRGLRQVDRVVPAGEDSRIWRFETTPGRVTRIAFES
jgi:hypothetical protein